MTIADRLPPGVYKEFRGLAVPWLACVAAMLVGSASGVRAFQLAVPAYMFGCSALGALSIGQEYGHRTLPLLLSQPVRRERLLLIKLGVLATMLVTLSALAIGISDARVPELGRLPFAVLPVMCGLCIAPWITMLTRSPLAGAVFTFGPAGWLLIATERVYVAVYGREPTADLAMAAVWTVTLGMCAIGAVMGWRMFMRLEAVDGGVAAVRLPRWLRRTTSTGVATSTLTKRHPIWMLVKKEIRLQHMAGAVAGFWVCGWVVLMALRGHVEHADDIFTAMTFFYTASIPVLIGSLASAEERELGTLEWQLLLPVATRTQWTVKVGTVAALTLLLALGLPGLLLAAIDAPAQVLALLFRPQIMVGIVALSAVGLYVSSLCANGLRAMLLSVAAGVAVLIPVSMAAGWVAGHGLGYVSLAQFEGARAWQAAGFDTASFGPFLGAMEFLWTAAIVAVLVITGLANHRSAEPAGGRTWRQAMAAVTLLWAGAMVLVGLVAMSQPSRFF